MWLRILPLLMGVATTTMATTIKLRRDINTKAQGRGDYSSALAESGFRATSELQVYCTEESGTFRLIVTDPDDELQKSNITVGGTGRAGCSAEGDDLVELDVPVNSCGCQTSVDGSSGNGIHTCEVAISHHPTPVGTAEFIPYWSSHQVTCDFAPVWSPFTSIPTVLPTSFTDISLHNSGIYATSRLETKCNETSLSLGLTVNDPESELEKSSIVVGDGRTGCWNSESTNRIILLELGINACGRVQTVEATRIVYQWKAAVWHYPATVDGIQFRPLVFTHEVFCEVPVLPVDPLIGNGQPGDEGGNTVGSTSPGFGIRLRKDDSTSTDKIWQFVLSPEFHIASGVSYKLTTCTATPTDRSWPVLTLIGKGCVTPKTGTRAYFSPLNNEYRLTVRAFGFAGIEATIDIQCTVELCIPLEDGLCEGQKPTLPDCTAAVKDSPTDEEGKDKSHADHGLLNRPARSVRSKNQYVTSNVVVV